MPHDPMNIPANSIAAIDKRIEFLSAMPPLHRASTIYFVDVADLEQRDWRQPNVFTYGRDGTPISRELEVALAALEGSRYVHLAPSGLAAFSLACLALLKAGDSIALPANGYGTGSQMASTLMRRFGVDVSVYEPTAPETWSQTIPEFTTLVWIEAPGSVTMEMPDLARLLGHARSVGALTGIDNTYSAGIHLRAFDLGVDVSMQALTKFQSGGSDVVMGCLSTSDDAIHSRILETRHLLGLGVSPDDAYLVLRSLPTLKMRYEYSSRSAEMLARWFLPQSGVHRVLYPPFEDSPGSIHWRNHLTAAAGLFSIALDDRVDSMRTKAFVDTLQRFRIGYSWGGPTSLVMPYFAPHPAVQRLRRLGSPTSSVIRFWIGLEDTQLLLEDITQAWKKSMTP